MNVRNTNWLFPSLVALLLSGCAAITVPNTRFCSVAGTISAGADCAYTLTDRTEEMDLEEFIDFLEPQLERPDPKKPGAILPERGGAICRSSQDEAALMIALEQACRKLGTTCQPQVLKQIKSARSRAARLYNRSLVKARTARR